MKGHVNSGILVAVQERRKRWSKKQEAEKAAKQHQTDTIHHQ